MRERITSVNLIEAKVIVGPRHFPEKAWDVADFKIVRSEGAQTNDSKILIPNHHRIRCTPLVAGEQARGDEIDIGLKRIA
jgi:hypothetical protein